MSLGLCLYKVYHRFICFGYAKWLILNFLHFNCMEVVPGASAPLCPTHSYATDSELAATCTSPAMIIAGQKLRNQAKPNLHNQRTALSQSQFAKFALKSIKILWCKGTARLQILENKENGSQKATLSQVKIWLNQKA